MGYLRRQLATRRGRRAALGIAAVLLLGYLGYRYSTRIRPPRLIYLPQTSAPGLIHALRDQGIDARDRDAHRYLHDRSVPSGWIRFEEGAAMDRADFYARLQDTRREPTRQVVMYSGETLHGFARTLSAQTGLSESKLLNAYYRYSPYSDGGILAGHYRVPYRTTANATMYALTRLSEDRFRFIAHHYGHAYTPESFKRTLILASIIQKETYHPGEMPLIASVIANRLRAHMKLQLDATLNYGPYAHTPVTPERIRTDASRFNTYRHYGLPPEPISSVTTAALRAAYRPSQTTYLFFVRNPQGRHDFSTTYAEHLEKIRRYKK